MTTIDAARTALTVSASLAARTLAEPWLMAAYHDKGYVPQAHHRLISREIRTWADTPNARLMVTTPPQVGKSWTAVVWTAFWLLARDPTARIIVACCTAELAQYHGGQIRERIDKYGHHHGVALKRGSNRGNFFLTTAGGYVRCVGVGGMTTGFPANYFIMDDLLKGWVEAMSPTQRERAWMWATSVGRTRMQRGGCMAYVGTRWNEDDVPGRLEARQPGRWRAVKIPALATAADDPLGRALGAPMPKPGIDEHDTAALLDQWELDRQDQPVVVWESMYQCDPVPAGGALIDTDVLQSLEDLKPTARPLLRAVSLDPSVGGRTSTLGAETGRQNTFGVVAGWLGDDDRVYITTDATRVMTPEEGCTVACQTAHDTGAGLVFIEGNQGGHTWAPLMVAAWERLLAQGKVAGHMPRLDIHNAKGDKATRAQIVAGFMHHDRIKFAAKLPALWKEWTSWRPGDDSPGRIDASGHLALKLLPARAINHAPAASPADSPMSGVGLGGY